MMADAHRRERGQDHERGVYEGALHRVNSVSLCPTKPDGRPKADMPPKEPLISGGGLTSGAPDTG
jgi:hypothetical protein